MAQQTNDVDFETDVLAKMKYISAMTLNTIRKKVNPNKRKLCFELFGFDFFLDIDYNVWLIEVNTNPCLEESSNILRRLLPRMLDDMFKLTLDQIYQPAKDFYQATNLQNPLAVATTISKSKKESSSKNRTQVQAQA